MTKIPTLIHNGTTVTPPNAFDDIEGNVVGHGTYVVSAGATLDFFYGVNGGQDIVLSNQHANGVYGASSLLINDPTHFRSHVDLTYKTPPAGAPALEQSSVGISMLGQPVDSYSFKNDMLKLWSGNKVVEQLSLTVHDPYGITVQAASGPYIFASANTATVQGIDFVHGHSPAMPVHST